MTPSPLRIGAVLRPETTPTARSDGCASGADSIVIDLEEPRTPYHRAGARDGAPAGPGVVRSPRAAGRAAARLRARAAAARPASRSRICGRSCGPAPRRHPAAQDREPGRRAWGRRAADLHGRRPRPGRGHDRHLPDPRDGAGDPAGVRDRHGLAARALHGRRDLALRRHPSGGRLSLDRRGHARRSSCAPRCSIDAQGRRHPLPDQRHVGRRGRRRRGPARLGDAACATSATTG